MPQDHNDVCQHWYRSWSGIIRQQAITWSNLSNSFMMLHDLTIWIKFGFKSFKYFGAKLWNVLPIDIKRSESLSIFKRSITAWCHSDAAKALEKKMFWPIPYCMLSLHNLINVADRHFKSFCSFIMYHFLILLVCLCKCSFNMVSFMLILRIR